MVGIIWRTRERELFNVQTHEVETMSADRTGECLVAYVEVGRLKAIAILLCNGRPSKKGTLSVPFNCNYVFRSCCNNSSSSDRCIGLVSISAWLVTQSMDKSVYYNLFHPSSPHLTLPIDPLLC